MREADFWRGVVQNVIAGTASIVIGLVYTVAAGVIRRPEVIFSLLLVLSAPTYLVIYAKFIAAPCIRVLNGRREVDVEEEHADFGVFVIFGIISYGAVLLGLLAYVDASFGTDFGN